MISRPLRGGDQQAPVRQREQPVLNRPGFQGFRGNEHRPQVLEGPLQTRLNGFE